MESPDVSTATQSGAVECLSCAVETQGGAVECRSGAMETGDVETESQSDEMANYNNALKSIFSLFK